MTVEGRKGRGRVKGLGGDRRKEGRETERQARSREIRGERRENVRAKQARKKREIR